MQIYEKMDIKLNLFTHVHLFSPRQSHINLSLLVWLNEKVHFRAPFLATAKPNKFVFARLA